MKVTHPATTENVLRLLSEVTGIRTAFKDWIHTKFVWLECNRPNHEIAERIYQENKAELEALLARTLPLEVGV